MAIIAVVVPIVTAMLALHTQNLLRGDRLFNKVETLSSALDQHAKKTRKLRKRIDGINGWIQLHAPDSTDIQSPAITKRIESK